ncbi:YolD-like family protein [Staphylococcus haemolyticus]|uniref:YolD-like family protein n=1 Tax=Staphylococcus haemolyticus TaxID=1283 RepID=UPI00187A1785|nr:YolD-like family protein [Staphylococcus haemolyticus]MBE7361527.1 YolD-like family protein [Staphylococcus haemolyticus]
MRPLPDEYKNETDYRKIPSEYLDKVIPQGREKINWQPFATIPEQFEKLKEYIIDQNKTDRSSLSSDQVEYINNKLNYCYKNHAPITIYYWNNGYISNLYCYIKAVDLTEKHLIVSNENGNQTRRISFKNVCDVD